MSIKRMPYALQFVDGLSPKEIGEQRKRYRRFSKADLLDAFADLWRQCEGDDKNIRHIFDEIRYRINNLRVQDLR